MNRIYITKTVFLLTMLFAVMYGIYMLTANWWLSIGSGVLLFIVWNSYYVWLNNVHRRKTQKYLETFSKPERQLEDYQKMVNFVFASEYCDGLIKFGKKGIHIRLDSAIMIPWANVKGMTLMTLSKTKVARLFLIKDDIEEKKIFIVWDEIFRDKIPEEVFLMGEV